MRDSRKISSFQSSSLLRKYSRCRSFMKGSFSDGRYVFNFSKAHPISTCKAEGRSPPRAPYIAACWRRQYRGRRLSRPNHKVSWQEPEGAARRRENSELPRLGELDLD